MCSHHICNHSCMNYLSLVIRKPTFWFPTWSKTKQAIQLQKMARGLKFRIEKVKGWYYLCSENKGADQLRGYHKADLRLSVHMQNVGFLLTWLIYGKVLFMYVFKPA